ncbi:VTT domain-containing protein [Chloroflexi bacterium TSY]|nr:VTT domain-containing protein [Chloroflexi bacterium TSY]
MSQDTLTAQPKNGSSRNLSKLQGESNKNVTSQLIFVQQEPQEPTHWWKQSAQRWFGILFVVTITVFSFFLALNPKWIAWAGEWGYVGAFLISLIASATIVLPAPGIAVVIAMGSALEPYILGIVSGIGSAFGELTGYIAGASGRALVPDAQRSRVEWLQKHTETYGPLLLLALAAIPFPLFDLAGIVAGALGMRIISFLGAISIGKSIKYIILILLGAGSIELFQRYWASLF